MGRKNLTVVDKKQWDVYPTAFLGAVAMICITIIVCVFFEDSVAVVGGIGAITTIFSYFNKGVGFRNAVKSIDPSTNEEEEEHIAEVVTHLLGKLSQKSQERILTASSQSSGSEDHKKQKEEE